MTDALVLLMGLVLTLTQSTDFNRTASLEGKVTRQSSGEPIAGAEVYLRGIGVAGMEASVAVRSATDGKFILKDVPAGRYRLFATKSGGQYVPTEYGQRSSNSRGVEFEISVGQKLKNFDIDMPMTGSITGRVLDAYQQPIGHAAVMALSPTYKYGRRVLNAIQVVHSDDHGDFRLFMLPPGQYFVAARPEDPGRRTVPASIVFPGRSHSIERAEVPVIIKEASSTGEISESTFRLVYYGGGADPNRAIAIELTSGMQAGGIDIPLMDGKIASKHVRGQVILPKDRLIVGAQVRAIPRIWDPDVVIPVASTDTSGNFDVAGLTPGEYLLYAVTNTDAVHNPAPLFGVRPIVVASDDLADIVLTPAPEVRVTGKVSWEDDKVRPELSKIRTVLRRDPDTLGLAPSVTSIVSLAGDFAVAVFPADWRVGLEGLPPNTYIKSIRTGQVDLTGRPIPVGDASGLQLEIILATDGGAVSGRAMDRDQRPVVNATILLAPDDPSNKDRWDLYKTQPTDSTGQFQITNVPPGNYKLFAWEAIRENEWQDQDILRGAELKAHSVHIDPFTQTYLELIAIGVTRQ